MSNSPLVSHVNLSPNNSGARTHKIDRITPHCTAGRCNVEALGALFAKNERQASSNYGIGDDGRIGMYVPEDSRSWCSSSNANDQRAVTIECSSEAVAPYVMLDAVYDSLRELCIDICRRNGKSRLIWIPDKASALEYEPGDDEMLITVHRWFSPRACPGEWLMARLSQLAESVTQELNAVHTDKIYRIQIGSFRHLDEAQKELEYLQSQGFVAARIVRG